MKLFFFKDLKGNLNHIQMKLNFNGKKYNKSFSTEKELKEFILSIS
ncbi:hypothetical protein [Fusobacterium ulcerans]|nr:hypothetical protein [Fusobacterium ulcerans]MCB8566298.1 hypothetical protein [Fusobacterium ulcerans]MCB8650399.1 hypothetical protein [Fusobacterium ulcerans]